jgi:hypothetical protein
MIDAPISRFRAAYFRYDAAPEQTECPLGKRSNHQWALFRSALGVCLALALAALPLRGNAQTHLQKSPSTNPQTQSPVTVSVNSARVIGTTGVPVTNGQVLKITASGTVNIADMNGPYETNPDGTIVAAPPVGSGAYNYFLTVAAPSGVPPIVGIKKYIVFGGQLNNGPYGSLIAGFSTNPNATSAFDFPQGFAVVGSSGTAQAPFDGYLYLAVDDVNNTFDDDGSFTATITPEAPPIASVEFTQAIQKYQSLSDFTSYLGLNNEPPVPIIAGKLAAMRVYFTPVTDATDISLTVTGPASGTKTISLVPGCQPLNQRAQSGVCKSLDFIFTPPPGTWTTTITVNDSSGNQLEQETFVIISRTTAAVVLESVTACNRNFYVTPFTKTCGNASFLSLLVDTITALAPTSNVIVKASNQEVDGSLIFNKSAPPTSPNWDKWAVLLAKHADALYIPSILASDLNSNQRTTFFGIYTSDFGTIQGFPIKNDLGASAAIDSHGAVGPDVALRFDINTTPDTYAHEIGHTYGLHHTNIGIPDSNTSPGCWFLADDSGTPYPYPDNRIQSLGGMLEYGYNVLAQKALDPNGTFDIMSYCTPRWITPFDYNTMITTLNGGVVPPTSNSAPRARLETQARPQAPPTIVTGPYWQISGTIDPVNGVAFDPVFTQTLAATTDAGAGTYSIEVLGSTGQILYTRFFTPQTTVVETDTGLSDEGTTIAPIIYFSQWVPVTAGATSFVVLDPTSTNVGTLAITGAPPVVAITSPIAGFVGSTNQQTVSWTIQDPNATTFTSRVFYSPDAGTTWYQVGETTGTSDTEDFTMLPGSSNALIRVDVSDGVNTGSATSVPFSVVKKMPSSIAITTPQAGYAQASVDPVYLSGSAFDADDGFLTGAALAWKSDIQGALGTGSPLSVKLNPGTHNITLTGTDSDGNAISASVSVIIGGARPVLTLTTSTLSANCISATVAAVPGAQGAALSQVQYSLDGGATYKPIALNQLPSSFVVPGSGNINLVAVASDLSHQSAAQSTELSIAAACVSGVPSVSGGSAQTTTVGAAFASALSALITDNSGNPVPGVAVNFTAPASGASATLSPASATSNANGIASVSATANSANGSYNVVATVPGFSTTAQFSLTNTDFTLALDNSTISVTHGSSQTATITVTPLSGFASSVTLGCSGLPVGVTCSFSPSTLTPSGGAITSTLTITASNNASTTASALRWGLSGGLVFALCLLAPGMRRRGVRRHEKYLGVLALLCVAAIFSITTGCSNFKPFTSTVTVAATSGALQHTSTVNLSVK